LRESTSKQDAVEPKRRSSVVSRRPSIHHATRRSGRESENLPNPLDEAGEKSPVVVSFCFFVGIFRKSIVWVHEKCITSKKYVFFK